MLPEPVPPQTHRAFVDRREAAKDAASRTVTHQMHGRAELREWFVTVQRHEMRHRLVAEPATARRRAVQPMSLTIYVLSRSVRLWSVRPKVGIGRRKLA